MTILSILLQMQQDRESKKIVPHSVAFIELLRECLKQGYLEEQVRNELNSLTVDKQITVNKTINDKAITVIA